MSAIHVALLYPIYSLYNALDPNDINKIIRDMHDCSQMGSIIFEFMDWLPLGRNMHKYQSRTAVS